MDGAEARTVLIWHRHRVHAGDFADVTGIQPGIDWSPDLDIDEGADDFVLVLSVPGVGADDLEVTVLDRTATIAGRRHVVLPEQVRAMLLESPRGRFLRRIRFAPGCDMTRIATTLRDGQLVIRVPRGRREAVRVPVQEVWRVCGDRRSRRGGESVLPALVLPTILVFPGLVAPLEVSEQAAVAAIEVRSALRIELVDGMDAVLGIALRPAAQPALWAG